MRRSQNKTIEITTSTPKITDETGVASTSGEEVLNDKNSHITKGINSSGELSGLSKVISKGEPLIKFPKCLTEGYCHDRLMKQIIYKPEQFCNFSSENGLLVLNENGRKRLCIPDYKLNGRIVWEMVITQAHSLLAHIGYRKPLNILENQHGGLL
jgi:hypothetical protein